VRMKNRLGAGKGRGALSRVPWLDYCMKWMVERRGYRVRVVQ